MAVVDPLSRYSADSSAFQPIDLAPGTAGVVSVSGLGNVDDASVAIDLGNNVFRFYGSNITANNRLYISSNGLISFGVADSSPNNNDLNNWSGDTYIAPLWDNWTTARNPSSDDLVLYQFQDSDRDGIIDHLVIEWSNINHAELPDNDSTTFQAVLSLNTGTTNGDIVFNYPDLAVDGGSGDSDINDGGSATIGIRSSTQGCQYAQLLIGLNGASSLPIGSGKAIRITSMPNPVSPMPRLVKEINTTSIGSGPSELTVFNGALYFIGSDGFSGDQELMRIDASGSTGLVKDIRIGQESSEVKGLTVAGSRLFFFAYDSLSNWGLWQSDGSEAGTTLVKTVDNPSDLRTSTVASSGGKFYFRGVDIGNGSELWVSDGTTAGTTRISNIEPGSGWSHPSNLTDVNGTLFFCATTSAGGTELYKSNGTAASTVLVKTIAAGPASSNPQELIHLNGTLYFSADDGANGRELWKSDGSSTSLVRNINANANKGSEPVNLTIHNNVLYFFANSGGGYQLWKSDGSSGGTVLVSPTVFTIGWSSGYTFNLFNLDGTLFFTNQGATTSELWKSNGSSVSKVTDLPSSYSTPSDFTNVDGILYFSLRDGGVSTGKELWKSNGTAAGTVLVRDVAPGPASSNPRELTAFNHQLYFVASSERYYHNPDELWRSNGSENGTVCLNINPTTLGAKISRPLLFNGKLYFTADDGVTGKELWCSDGSRAGTQLVKDIREGANSSEIQQVTAMGGNLYFFAYDNSNGYGL